MLVSDRDICSAMPRKKPYKLFDGSGLYVHIRPGGGKYWRIKYRFAGKENQASLGVYPEVSIAEARVRRDSVRALLAAGFDPNKQRRQISRDAAARAVAAMRYAIDSDGALTIRLGDRRVELSPQETNDLREFLDATKSVGVKR